MKKKRQTTSPPAVRASISFPPDLYATLENIASKKKVSLAWVVRDAVEMYVANDAKDRDGIGETGRARRTP